MFLLFADGTGIALICQITCIVIFITPCYLSLRSHEFFNLERVKMEYQIQSDTLEGRICIGRQLVEPSSNAQRCVVAIEAESGKDAFEYKRVQILRLAAKGKIVK